MAMVVQGGMCVRSITAIHKAAMLETVFYSLLECIAMVMGHISTQNIMVIHNML